MMKKMGAMSLHTIFAHNLLYLKTENFNLDAATVNVGYSDQDHAHKSIAIMDIIVVIR